MKHISLQIGAMLACLCLSAQPLRAINPDIVKQKLVFAYNLVDTFVTEQELLTSEPKDIDPSDFARMHHKLIRKILHWIMGDKQYVASNAPEYAQIGTVLDLTYVILQETHPYGEDEFQQIYGFPLDVLAQASYSEDEIATIGDFVAGTPLWSEQGQLLALCNAFLQSRL